MLLAFNYLTPKKSFGTTIDTTDSNHNTMAQKDLKIFIADSDDYCTFVYKQLLQELGYKSIYTMVDADSCINSLVLAPDVIFLDYSINNFEGLNILKKIKGINPDIHVILLSQIEDMNSSADGIKFGAYDLILKGGIEEEHIKMVLENISHLNKTKSKTTKYNVFQKVASFFW